MHTEAVLEPPAARNAYGFVPAEDMRAAVPADPLNVLARLIGRCEGVLYLLENGVWPETLPATALRDALDRASIESGIPRRGAGG